MLLIKLILSLLLPIATGYALLKFLFRKKSLGLDLRLALSYGLGLGLLAQWMLFLGMVGTHFSVQKIGVALIALMFLFSFLTLKKKNLCSSPDDPISQEELPQVTENGFLMKIILFLFYSFAAVYIIYYVGYVFWRALNIPIIEWDALSTIAFKAKVFFFEKSIYQHHNLPFPSYPLFIPLIQSWVALNLGQWHEQLPQIIFPLAFLSYLVIHYRFLRLYTNRVWGLLGIILLMSSNFFIYHATITYRDFFMLYYNCSTILLLLLWHKKQDDAWLWLAGIFAGFTTFVKLEGTEYLMIHAVLFLLILRHQKISLKEKKFKLLKFLIPAFMVGAPYYLCKAMAGVSAASGRLKLVWALENFSKIPAIAVEFFSNLFLSGNWNIIWFLFVRSLLNIRQIKKCFEARILIVAIGLYLGMYFFSDLVMTNSVSQISILSRVILHSFPLSTIAIILINAPSKINERGRVD